MESKSLTGKWQGFFILDESYGPVLKGKKGHFEMDLIDNNGNLTGKCIDTHGFGIHEKRAATVEGKFENGWIHFVKKYDKAIPIDAFGSNVEGATFNTEVHYEAAVDHMGKVMKGNWKISLKENPSKEEDYTSGKFDCRKIG